MYLVTDKFDYPVPPKWGFAKGGRNTFDTKPKYDYYLRPDNIVGRGPHVAKLT